jgi:hypothetical protein
MASSSSLFASLASAERALQIAGNELTDGTTARLAVQLAMAELKNVDNAARAAAAASGSALSEARREAKYLRQVLAREREVLRQQRMRRLRALKRQRREEEEGEDSFIAPDDEQSSASSSSSSDE